MFATSTKTATFLPTLTPMSCVPTAGATCAARRRSDADRARSGLASRHGPGHERATLAEAAILPAGSLAGIVGQRRLDDGAALVARGTEDLLEQVVGDARCVDALVHGQQVDRADVSAGMNRRTQGEDRTTNDLAPAFGDEHAGLRQVDELPQ